MSTVSELKTRVKELESQVSDYKKRLDELRKAKSTTIVKREREVLELNTPNLGAKGDPSKVEQLQREISQLRLKHENEISGMKQKLADPSKQSTHTNNDDEIARLKARIVCLEDEKTTVMVQNTHLNDKLEELITELSIKEAQWCEKEEQLNEKLRKQWGEKYKEWMADTEKKIAELQQANNLLRAVLLERAPRAGDPNQGAHRE